MAEVPGFEVTSPAFGPGGDIPAEYTCDGDGRAPPLMWTGIPEGTEELALIIDDPDAPGGTYVHAVLYGLDPEAPGIPSESPTRYAVNDSGDEGYSGPCPPEGDPPHRYVFALYALGEELSLEAGGSHEDARMAIEAAAIARTTLVGLYGR